MIVFLQKIPYPASLILSSLAFALFSFLVNSLPCHETFLIGFCALGKIIFITFELFLLVCIYIVVFINRFKKDLPKTAAITSTIYLIQLLIISLWVLG